ncbi:hypothetical protein R4B61_03100 [Fructilactobacillus vespulae]|uniref:hypothetical protein n=1 Tax=Fructilactobacillus vespulae TaxID=1249630 RepID=UPI0039B397DD
MITQTMKDGLKTAKEHKWSILGMWLPSFIIGLVLNGFSNVNPNTAMDGQSASEATAAIASSFSQSIGVVFVISIIASLFEVSLQMGLLKADEEGHFEFKKAFVGFKEMIWLSVIGISFLTGILVFAVAAVILVATIGFAFAGNSQANNFYYVIAGIVGLLGGIALIYITLGLKFIYLTFYKDTKDLDNGLFKAFPATWKLMKGHRLQLLGMAILQILIAIVAVIVLGLIIGLVIWLGTMISVAGLALTYGIIFGVICFALALVVFFFLSIWFAMNNIKFFRAINK